MASHKWALRVSREQTDKAGGCLWKRHIWVFHSLHFPSHFGHKFQPVQISSEVPGGLWQPFNKTINFLVPFVQVQPVMQYFVMNSSQGSAPFCNSMWNWDAIAIGFILSGLLQLAREKAVSVGLWSQQCYAKCSWSYSHLENLSVGGHRIYKTLIFRPIYQLHL